MTDRMVAKELQKAHNKVYFDAGYRAGLELLVTRLLSAEAVAAAVQSYDASDRENREDAMAVALAEALGATEFLVESEPGTEHDQDAPNL